MRNKSALTLLEIIIMVLVFALAAALCMRVFVYSAKESGQDRINVLAERQAQAVAEVLKASRGNVSAAAETLSRGQADRSAVGSGSRLEVLYNEKWQQHSALSASYYSYKVAAECRKDGYLGTAEITVTDASGKVLYSFVSSWQEVSK